MILDVRRFIQFSYFRTTSRHTAVVKWGRLWLFKDILMSLGRPSGIGARFATAEALASPRSVD